MVESKAYRKALKYVLKIILYPFYFLFIALPNIVDNIFFHFMKRFIKLTRRNCLFIINPSSGKKLGPKIIEILQDMGDDCSYVDIFQEDYIPKIKSVLSKNPSEDLNVIICGGDGTVNSIIARVNKEIPEEEARRIIYIPMPIGTGNDLSRSLNLGAKININFVGRFFNRINSSKAKIREVDWWNIKMTKNDGKEEILKRRFLLYVGIGYDAEVVTNFEELRMKFGFLFKSTVD